MGQYTFELPWPPSVNEIYRRSRRGVTLTRAAKRYRDAALAALVDQRWTFDGWVPGVPGPPLVRGRLAVEVKTREPDDGRDHDLDNLFKATFDGLEAANVFRNDVQIDRISVERGPASRTPMMFVTIGNLPGRNDD